MKTALTIWENRISPVFDSSDMILLVETQNGEVTNRRYESLECRLPLCRVRRLVQLGAEELICGAISDIYVEVIEAQGIRVIPFITGEVNDVLGAYLQGMKALLSHQMPGWGRVKR